MLSFLISAVLGSVLLTSPAPDDAAVIAAQLPTYPLSTCAISGKPLGGMGEPIDLVQDGRLVRLCCEGCIKGVREDPEAIVAKLDAAVVEAQREAYPVDTCLVSGEPLGGDMGAAIEHVVGTRLVRLCCKGCLKQLDAEPARFMSALDAAYIQAQLADYPLDTCPISNEALVEGEIVDMLYGNQLVRLCCAPCEKKLRANPGPALAAIARASASAGEHEGHGERSEHGEHDGRGDHDGDGERDGHHDGNGEHDGHGDHDEG